MNIIKWNVIEVVTNNQGIRAIARDGHCISVIVVNSHGTTLTEGG